MFPALNKEVLASAQMTFFRSYLFLLIKQFFQLLIFVFFYRYVNKFHVFQSF